MLLCLPRAHSPGNPAAAAAKTTEMFVIYVLHQIVSSAGGKVQESRIGGSLPGDLRGVKLKQAVPGFCSHVLESHPFP